MICTDVTSQTSHTATFPQAIAALASLPFPKNDRHCPTSGPLYQLFSVLNALPQDMCGLLPHLLQDFFLNLTLMKPASTTQFKISLS